MGNEKYINYYIETLTSTLTDVIIRNVSMQANEKINNEVIENLSKELDTVKTNYDNQTNVINQLQNDNAQNSGLRNDYESLKSQVANIEIFRNELIKERENHQITRDQHQKTLNEMQSIIDGLNAKIEELQSPPAKKKTIKSKPSVLDYVQEKQDIVSKDAVKDGGSF
jgi:chromosome segregation ATPase